MATFLATKEIRTMQSDDLKKEINEKRLIIGKMQVELELRSEKDTAQFLRHKKELARMLTIQNEMKSGKAPLKAAPKTAKVPASTSAKATVGKSDSSSTK